MSQSQLEALSLKDSQLPKVKVHATAIFSILNHFIRRTPREGRVMGTLLGEVKEDGTVEITDCFAVPFTEKVEEAYVAIDQKYHTLMYAFHRRNNKKEKALGWYTSTTGQGQFIIDTSSLIQDFYSSECANPGVCMCVYVCVCVVYMCVCMCVYVWYLVYAYITAYKRGSTTCLLTI
jgi:proteasome lid subunit RPN8/RPN11